VYNDVGVLFLLRIEFLNFHVQGDLYSVRGLERSELGGSHGMPRAPLGPIFMTGLPER